MIIYGINPAQEALRSNLWKLRRLLLTSRRSGRLQKIMDAARAQGVPVGEVSPAVLKRKAGTERHQGILGELDQGRLWSLEDLLSADSRVLVLPDGVEDPRNLGAVLRTAEAVGVGGALLPSRNCCGLTSLVVKASAGAALHVPIARIGNVAGVLDRCREAGFWTVGLDMDGDKAASEIDATLPLVVVVGGEGRGLRPAVRKKCDFLVSLPLRGKVGSLNLSVAAGILLYQLFQGRTPS